MSSRKTIEIPFDHSISPLSSGEGQGRGRRGRNGGFSIVEVLVAGALLGIALIATVAMIQKSGDLQAAGNRRVAARVFLSSQFETIYRDGSYHRISAPKSNPQTISMKDPLNGAVYSADYYTTITSVVNTTISTVNNVSYKDVTLALAWFDADGTRDSIALSKWIVQ